MSQRVVVKDVVAEATKLVEVSTSASAAEAALPPSKVTEGFLILVPNCGSSQGRGFRLVHLPEWCVVCTYAGALSAVLLKKTAVAELI